MLSYIRCILGVKHVGNLAFSQTGSQFVYACTVDLRTSANKGEENPSMQTTVCVVTFACLFTFVSFSSQNVIRMHGNAV